MVSSRNDASNDETELSPHLRLTIEVVIALTAVVAVIVAGGAWHQAERSADIADRALGLQKVSSDADAAADAAQVRFMTSGELLVVNGSRRPLTHVRVALSVEDEVKGRRQGVANVSVIMPDVGGCTTTFYRIPKPVEPGESLAKIAHFVLVWEDTVGRGWASYGSESGDGLTVAEGDPGSKEPAAAEPQSDSSLISVKGYSPNSSGFCK